MKKLFVLLVLIAIAAAIGVLLGTEPGRARKDELLGRMGQGTGGAGDTGDAIPEL